MRNKRPFTHTCLMTFIGLSCLLSCTSEQLNINTYGPEIIITWNEKIIELAEKKDGLLTLNGVRTEALANAAAHNALNAINPVYAFYKYSGIQPEADPIAYL